MGLPNSANTFFLVRGWEYPSDSLLLGSVITNPLTELAIFTPLNLDSPVQTTKKSHFALNLATTNNPTPGLFGTFLNQYGLGNEESLHYDRKAVRSYSFTEMESQAFTPTQALLRKTVEAERVAAFFRASEHKTPVYMITGVKSIRGAGVTATSSRGPGWLVSLSLGVDREGEGPNPPSVVFAFQLTQVRRSTDGEISSSSCGFKVDEEFGEGTFTFTDGFDEEDGSPCRIIAPSLTSFDLLTASSARTDPSAVRGARKCA